MKNYFKKIYTNSTVTTKQYDSTYNSISEEDILTCNSTKFIKCDLNFNYPLNVHILSIFLKFPKLSGSKTSFYISNYNEGEIQPVEMIQEEVGVVSNIDDDFQLIDITSVVLNSEVSNFTFLIRPSNALSKFTCLNNPTIEIEGISDEHKIYDDYVMKLNDNKYITTTISPLFYNFNFSINLFSLEGGYIPLDLKLIYNHYNNHNSLCTNWKFNYDSKIIKDGTDYIYYDGKSKIHVFKPSNDSTTYYDITEPGLILYVQPIPYVNENNHIITDEKHLKLFFNSFGNLVKKQVMKTDTLISELNISYNDGKISSITDDLGRICLITYTENSITIQKPDNSIITILLENNKIININGLIDNSAINVPFSFEYEENYINKICTPTEEVIEFLYINNGLLHVINSYYTHNNELYKTHTYKFLNKRNETIIEKYGVNNFIQSKKVICYNNDGNVNKTYDIVDGTICNEWFNTRGLYSRFNNNNEINKIEFSFLPNVDESISINSNDTYTLSSAELAISSNNSNIQNNFHLSLFLTINQISKIYLLDVDNIIFQFVSIENDNENLIYSTPVKLELNNEQIISEFITLPSNTCSYKGKLVFNGINCNLNISNLILSKNYSQGKYDCIQTPTNGKLHNVGYSEWYNLTNVANINYDLYEEEVLNLNLFDIVMTKFDYQLTLNSYYYNKKANGTHNLWYNNGQGFLSNVKNIIFTLKDGFSFPIDSMIIATVEEFEDKSVVEIIEYSSNGYNKYNEVFYNNTQQIISTRETRDRYNRLLSKNDSKNKSFIYTNTINSNSESQEIRILSNFSGENAISQQIKKINYNNINVDAIEYYEKKIDYPSSSHENFVSNLITVDKNSGMISKETLNNNNEIVYTYKNDNTSLDEICSNLGNINNSNTFLYLKNKNSGFSHNNFSYIFTFGSRNELTNVDVGPYSLLNNTYLYNSMSKSITSVYNTGYSEVRKYDLCGRLVSIYDENNNQLYFSTYSIKNTDYVKENNLTSENCPDSKLRKAYDGRITTFYYYDSTDYNLDNPNIISMDNGFDQLTKIENIEFSKTIGYDEKRRKQTVNLSIGNFNVKQTISYYDGDLYNNDRISNITLTYDSILINKVYTYDVLNRLISEKQIKQTDYIEKCFSYFTGTNYTSNKINQISYKINGTIFDTENIKYDLLGNICEITYQDGKKVEYIYDEIGRLTRENNQQLNKTYCYAYDAGGNIISKIEYTYSSGSLENIPSNDFIFTYDSIYKDKLLQINNHELQYNGILLSSYKGQYFTWAKQNVLNSFKTSISSNPVYYQYNSLKQRYNKNQVIDINVIENTDYVYEGNRLVKETKTIKKINENDLTPGYSNLPIVKTIYYIYDENDLIGFKYDGNNYFYVKDSIGNIKYLLNSLYEVVCMYVYDAWGNHVVYEKTNDGYIVNNGLAFIGNINPIRYKGYYFDFESNLYYCNSRYYSPELCRWISHDSIQYLNPKKINGLNLYIYCSNNPIMYCDYSGEIQEDIKYSNGFDKELYYEDHEKDIEIKEIKEIEENNNFRSNDFVSKVYSLPYLLFPDFCVQKFLKQSLKITMDNFKSAMNTRTPIIVDYNERVSMNGNQSLFTEDAVGQYISSFRPSGRGIGEFEYLIKIVDETYYLWDNYGEM